MNPDLGLVVVSGNLESPEVTVRLIAVLIQGPLELSVAPDRVVEFEGTENGGMRELGSELAESEPVMFEEGNGG